VKGTAATLTQASLEIKEPTGSPRSPGSTIATLNFQFNPKDYKVAMTANWKHEPSKAPKPPEFTGISPRSLTFEMFFDATEVEGGDVSKTVDTLFSCMVPTKKSVSDNNPCPPFITLVWGKNKKVLFTAYMKLASADFTLFRGDGTPIRAVCSVTIEEYQLAVPPQNPTSGGLAARRSRQVIAGDTLASIAYQEYGSANLWRALADANGIDDPLRVRPGQRLLIPPPEEAAALA
jgi:nucleoid-associated protein YgaU